MPNAAKSRWCCVPMSAISCSGARPSCCARIMIAVPWVSSAHMKPTRWPHRRWKRAQMSVWMYSTRWPRWIGPFAYGSALVTRICRAMPANLARAGVLVEAEVLRRGADGGGRCQHQQVEERHEGAELHRETEAERARGVGPQTAQPLLQAEAAARERRLEPDDRGVGR